jgi:hypothetical protein
MSRAYSRGRACGGEEPGSLSRTVFAAERRPEDRRVLPLVERLDHPGEVDVDRETVIPGEPELVDRGVVTG